MTYPTLSLVAAIGDLTEYARDPGITITRGSTSQNITGFVADAGQATTVLDNIDRTFDPLYSTGPFFGDLVPGVSVTAEATWEAVDYPVFDGFVDGWPQTYPLNGLDQLIDFRATDAFQSLATASAITSRPVEHTGERIQAILDLIGYPGPTDIAVGMSKVCGISLETVSALSHISDCAQVEFGELFVTSDGTLTFRDRTAIITDARSSVSQATFVQRAPATPYVGLQFSDVTMGSPPLVNECVVSYGTEGRQVTVTDAASIAEPWGLRSFSVSLPFVTASQARGYARWLVLLYAYPLTNFTSITLTPANEPGAAVDLWQQALTRELGDLITVTLDPLALGVNGRPALSGDPITRDCWIRGITRDFPRSGPWSATLTLQDASWLEGLFIWDTSELDGPDYYGL